MTQGKKRSSSASRGKTMSKIARPITRRLIPLGMPPLQQVRLKYCDQISLNPGVGSIASHYFSANGMYDPDVTGTGHQPLYFDQFMVSYDHYTVTASKIKVTQLPDVTQGGTSEFNPLWGIMVDDNTSFTYASAAAVIESNQGKGEFRIGSRVVEGGLHTSGKEPAVTRYFNARKFFGHELNADHSGSAAAQPTDQAYFALWATGVDLSGDPQPIEFMVEIEYTATLKEPHYVAQS